MSKQSTSKTTVSPWPPPWARIVGFITGMGMMIFELVVERSANLFVYGIGFILTGLPIARGVEKLLDLIGGIRK